MPRVQKDRQRRTQAPRPVPPDKICQVIPTAGELSCPLRGYGDSPARLCSAHRDQHTKLYLAYKAFSQETERLGELVEAEPDWQDNAHWTKDKVDAAIATREQYIRALDAELGGREAHRSRFIAEQDDGHAQWLRRLQDKRSNSCDVLEQLRKCRDMLIQEAIRAEDKAQRMLLRRRETESQIEAYWNSIRQAQEQRAAIRKQEERARLEAEAVQRKEREAARRKEEIARFQAQQAENARRVEEERVRKAAQQAAETERSRQARLAIQQQEAYRSALTRPPPANVAPPPPPTNTRQPILAVQPASYYSRSATDVEAQRPRREDESSNSDVFCNALVVLMVGAFALYALVRWVG
ncbi:hypothetical protein C8Q78DRAFT_395396 [Trametes maxima]|nr:hypothetical protein C8Q78DRAFT_395396 [Trametes maxima]